MSEHKFQKPKLANSLLYCSKVCLKILWNVYLMNLDEFDVIWSVVDIMVVESFKNLIRLLESLKG